MEDMHTKKVIVEDADNDFREYISFIFVLDGLSLWVMLLLLHWPNEEQGPLLNRVNFEYQVTLC